MKLQEEALKYLGKGSLIDKRALSLLTITIISFVLGIGIMNYQATPTLLVFSEGTLNLLIVSTVFTLGFLFFGYLTPAPMFFVGTHVGNIIVNSTLSSVNIAVLCISAPLSAYSSIMLGDALLKDMAGKSNFLKVLKMSMILLILSLVIAGAGDILA